MQGHYPDCTNPDTCWCEARRLSRVLGIALLILGMEVVGGIASGSLALLADAGHVFSDSIVIIVALVAAVAIQRGANVSRARGITFWVAIALLVAAAAWILYEAVRRLQEPRDIISPVMVGVATLGAVGNYLQHRILVGAASEHKHKAHRALLVHVWSDLLQSIAVVAGGLAIWLLNTPVIVDTVLSIAIVLWIVYQVVRLFKGRHTPDPHHHRGHHHIH